MAAFLENRRPLLTAMIAAHTPEDAIAKILDSHADGAEAFYIQLELLCREYWEPQTLRRIFSYCRSKPVIVTAYRFGHAAGRSDDERAQLLLLGLECGAAVCDVMGDLFHPEADQLTFDKAAVQKQTALIREIHERGGEVLMSTHLSRFFQKEELIAYAKAQQSRGADLCKLVNRADTQAQLLENLQTAAALQEQLSIPYLLLANGAYSRLLRLAGVNLGVCMYLCLQRFTALDFPEQPLLREAAQARAVLL